MLAAARHAERAARGDQHAAFALGEDGDLHQVAADDDAAVIAWRPRVGWVPAVSASDPFRALIDLYAPLCSATRARPVTLGHLGQSLDGFIATHDGDSKWITGAENLRHMHRLRALCDAVIVGAGTVAADDPQLTTRLVPGPNPLRVVYDPARRLDASARVFTDNAAPTLYVCAASAVHGDERQVGRARIASLAGTPETAGVEALLELLRARGCVRLFVEGGGATVSACLEAGVLDRLQITIAPVIIGSGRPAVRLAPPATLGACPRPAYRVFRMGGDILFDCDLRATSESGASAGLERVV